MTVNDRYDAEPDERTFERPGAYDVIHPKLPIPRDDLQYNQSLICFAEADDFADFFEKNGALEKTSEFYFANYPAYHECLQVLTFYDNVAFDLLGEKQISSDACGIEHVSEQSIVRCKSIFNVSELRNYLAEATEPQNSYIVRLLFETITSLDSEFHVNFCLNFYLVSEQYPSRMREALENCFRLLRQQRYFVGFSSHIATSFLENYLNKQNVVLNLCSKDSNESFHLTELPPLLMMGKKELLTRQLAKNRKLEEQILSMRAEIEALERVRVTGDKASEKLVLRLAKSGMTADEIANSMDIANSILPPSSGLISAE